MEGMQRAFQVHHIAAIDPERSNGISISATRLSEELNRLNGVEAWVHSVGIARREEVEQVLINLRTRSSSGGPSLAVFHGIWLPSFWRIAAELEHRGTPYVIVPRSSLMRRSLLRSAPKKLVGYLLGARRFIHECEALQFLNEEEAVNSVHCGKEWFIAGNGVDAFDCTDRSSGEGFEDRGAQGAKYLLFLGRLDVSHKGLDLLIKGVAHERSRIRKSGYKVVLAGDDYRGGANRISRMIHRLDLKDLVSVRPERVSGVEKGRLFCNAQGFLHPSRFEGEPQAVLEAFSARLPVLVTRGTNMGRLVQENRVGLVTDCTSKSIGQGVVDLIRGIEEGCYRDGQRWRFVKQKAWTSVAVHTGRQYAHVLGISSEAVALQETAR